MTKKPPKQVLENEPLQKQSQLQLAEIIKKCLPPLDDENPVLLVLAGPNGSGKSTFFSLFEHQLNGIPFINADVLNQAISMAPASDVLAQRVSDIMRTHYIEQKASFVTETVFSDTVGAKQEMLRNAQRLGFRVVLLYVAIPSPDLSKLRVAGRVQAGGHSVPFEKLERRFHASLDNLSVALKTVDFGIVVENATDLSGTSFFEPMAFVAAGEVLQVAQNIPSYIAERLPEKPRRDSKNKSA